MVNPYGLDGSPESRISSFSDINLSYIHCIPEHMVMHMWLTHIDLKHIQSTTTNSIYTKSYDIKRVDNFNRLYLL